MTSHLTQTVVALIALFFSIGYSGSAAEVGPSSGVLSASYSGSFMGCEYVTEVLFTTVAKARTWAAAELNPPLSVRAAERAASNALSRVVGDMKGWKRVEINLDEWKQGYWTYRFSFAGPSIQTTNAMRLKPSSLIVVVLMNGEAIAPMPKPEMK